MLRVVRGRPKPARSLGDHFLARRPRVQLARRFAAKRLDHPRLRRFAGHASATMTLDVYGHLITERASEAADLYDPLTEAAGRSVVDAALQRPRFEGRT